MRAFIGIPLPQAVRHALAQLHAQLAAAKADVKWVDAENLHVTLKFLGEITDAQREATEGVLRGVVSQEAPFSLGMTELGAFPSMTSPRVIWVGLGEGKERVVKLAQAIEATGAAIPLRREDLPAALRTTEGSAAQAGRPFAAHVTVGRVRSPRGRSALVAALGHVTWCVPAPWPVSSVVLYESVLKPTGPHYSVFAEVPLGAG